MIDFEKVTRFFNNESIYCFTSDLDWAPELVIEETLTLFNSLEVPLTPFIMHNSETTNKYYGKNRKAQYFGLHTNFLPNSSHGNNYMQQIDFVINLWPDVKCFRSHSYFDNSKITHEFYKRGFRYDSNICLFSHSYCTLLRHQSDSIRFPVFWEDDAHWE